LPESSRACKQESVSQLVGITLPQPGYHE